jgi:hypothetical protein
MKETFYLRVEESMGGILPKTPTSSLRSHRPETEPYIVSKPQCPQTVSTGP